MMNQQIAFTRPQQPVYGGYAPQIKQFATGDDYMLNAYDPNGDQNIMFMNLLQGREEDTDSEDELEDSESDVKKWPDDWT